MIVIQSLTACSAGGGTRTRTTAKSLVFETNASTIPPLPLLVVLLPASRSRHFHAKRKVACRFMEMNSITGSGRKLRQIFKNAQ